MPADISEAFRFIRNDSKAMVEQGKSADLPVTVDDVLVAAKLLQPHGAPGVQLLGRNTHLAAQTKLAAVRKAGGAVHIHGGAVYRLSLIHI